MKNYPGPRKVLGTVLQYSFFSVISRFPLKTVHPFRKFLPVLPPPTHPVQSWNSKKNSGYTRPILFVAWGEGLDLCESENAPEMQKYPKTFVHYCLKKRSVEKTAILRGFQACKRVFSGFWWKIVDKQTFSQLFAVFWTCLMTLLETNIVVSQSACIIPKDNITFNKTHVRKQSREATSY